MHVLCAHVYIEIYSLAHHHVSISEFEEILRVGHKCAGTKTRQSRDKRATSYIIFMYLHIAYVHACAYIYKGRAISYIINMYMHIHIHVYVGHMGQGR